MNNNINGKVVIIDPDNEYEKLVEMLGGEVIRITPNSGTFINPFEFEVNKDTIDIHNNRENIISNIKELLSQHYKFANEFKEQKLNVSDIKEICLKNNFAITDEELLNIIHECEWR